MLNTGCHKRRWWVRHISGVEQEHDESASAFVRRQIRDWLCANQNCNRLKNVLQSIYSDKRALLFSLSYILSCVGQFSHLFCSLLTSFAILLQSFLLHHLCMHCCLCLWHNVATFFSFFISSHSNSPHAFLSTWKTSNYFWLIHPYFKSYLFPAESSLAWNLWNKIIIIVLFLRT